MHPPVVTTQRHRATGGQRLDTCPWGELLRGYTTSIGCIARLTNPINCKPLKCRAITHVGGMKDEIDIRSWKLLDEDKLRPCTCRGFALYNNRIRHYRPRSRRSNKNVCVPAAAAANVTPPLVGTPDTTVLVADVVLDASQLSNTLVPAPVANLIVAA